jgi:hypothetical protein
MLNIGQSAGKTKALHYIIGVYLGDGCASYSPQSRSYTFILNTIDKDFAEATMDSLETLLEKKPRMYEIKKEPPRKLVYRVEINSKDLYEYLKKETLNKLIIPDFIKENQDKKLVREFVAGLMDSEGWFSRTVTRSGFTVYQMGIAGAEAFVTELPEYFKAHGLECGKICKMKVKPGHKPMLRILINKISWINEGFYFKIQRKQNKCNEFAQNLTPKWSKKLLNPQRLHVEPQSGKI